MKMGIKYEVSAKTGEYQDKEGNTKARYIQMGVVIEGPRGLSLKLESIPVNWDGWAYLNTPKPKEVYAAKAKNTDDVPF